LAFDVAVHVGSLAAVMLYFRRDIANVTVAGLRSLKTRRVEGDARLAWAIVLGTIPVGLAGLLFADFIEANLRSALVIATTTIVFGLLLWVADRHGATGRNEHQLRWIDILVIGVAQALALIPGTSRSGITMTAGLLMGLDRVAAARFSFLLSIPVIILAGGLETVKLVQAQQSVAWGSLFSGALLSFMAAYSCIHFFLKWLPKVGMLPFVIYRVGLGVILFAWFA
ncbi:MAG: undecaprenyl-diphosphate phosphatase, partial [Gammaproteobacteria bacterium]|nr:undecaprenyl-diphosphate phosphatase [Gammaproteobacteria bacterium]